MSIKKYVIRALGAFATVATLTACSAPAPDEKESEAIFGSLFDKGIPHQAVGRYIPFGPDDKKGVIYVDTIKPNNDGTELCLEYSTISHMADKLSQGGLTYCRPAKKIETGAAATTPKAQL